MNSDQVQMFACLPVARCLVRRFADAYSAVEASCGIYLPVADAHTTWYQARRTRLQIALTALCLSPLFLATKGGTQVEEI